MKGGKLAVRKYVNHPSEHNLSFTTTMADLYKEQLILCVKGFPVLYNHQRPEYRDLMAKGRCWEIIASQLGRDVNQVKKTWKNLKDSYRQACYIEARRRKSEPDAAPKKKWRFMELMSFLGPFMLRESGLFQSMPAPPAVENGEMGEEDTEFGEAGIECVAAPWEESVDEGKGDQEQDKMENDSETSTTISSHVPMPSTLPTSSTIPTPSSLPVPSSLPLTQLATPKPVAGARSRKRKAKVDDINDIDDTSSEFISNAKHTRVYLVEKATAESLTDEEGLVGQTVAAALRRLPPYKRALAKVKIHELLLEIEFGTSDGQQH